MGAPSNRTRTLPEKLARSRSPSLSTFLFLSNPTTSSFSRFVSRTVSMARRSEGLSSLLENNRRWSERMKAEDPGYFDRLKNQQAPKYLWIGCADSRVPANQILGLHPGEVFVQRNVGNLAVHRDMNCMACLEYAVDALKVEHVVVCGHYGCGAVRGALELPSSTGGNVGHWISDIRATRDRNGAHLMNLPGGAQARWDRLCELNVAHQVFNVCTSPVVQAAWERGQKLSVHGAIYSLSDGLLHELTPPMSSAADLDEAARAAERKVLLAAQGLSLASDDGEIGEKEGKEPDAATAAAIKVASCCSAGAGCGCGPAGASAAVLSGNNNCSGSSSPTKGASASASVPIRRGGSCERLSELAPAFSLGTMLGAELGTHRWFESGGGSAQARKEEEEKKNGH